MSGARAVAGELLALAAAPTFAVMAIVTAVSGDGMEMHGHTAHGSPLSEMTTMYLLMAVFHTAVWVRRMRAGA